MSKSHVATQEKGEVRPVPRGLLLFCFALMGPAFAINSAFIAIAIPAMAPYGISGLVVAGAVGSVFGIFPALWLARRIDAGIRDE
jgi:hypothetical protein